MKATPWLLSCLSALSMALAAPASAAAAPPPFVRLADLEIDPARLPQFTAAINEGIAAAIRTEPGVLVLYAVAEEDRPHHIRVFEMYASAAAYQAHLATPHFQKFRTTTDSMVVARQLLNAVPVALGAKEGMAPPRR